MSTADARLRELVVQAARAVTDQVTGRFDNKNLVDEIRARLADESVMGHVRDAGADLLAKSLATGFAKKRNPKPGKPSGMFHPEAILSLGDGKRIWMEYATDRDLIEWARQSTRNLARVANAEGDRQTYVADRLGVMRDHPGWLLGRVERELFDYAEESDFDDFDDGDLS